MQVNMTLLLQIGNFFVAYYFLSNYFFKPALKILLEEESDEHKLKDAIRRIDKDKSHRLKEKQSRWAVIQKRLLSMVPDLSKKRFLFPFYQDEQSKQLEQKELLSLKQRAEIKKILKDKLLDV